MSFTIDLLISFVAVCAIILSAIISPFIYSLYKLFSDNEYYDELDNDDDETVDIEEEDDELDSE